jgi:hypothetical protein
MSYNGHRNRNAWNVYLWLLNDAGAYNLCQWAIGFRNRDDAARALVKMLPERTPDGVKYTVRNVRLALRGMR